MTEDRAAEMRAWAEAHGFEYGADVPEDILSLPFYLFTLGQDGPVVTGEHMLTGGWNGMPVDLFDVNVPVADGVQKSWGSRSTGPRTRSSRPRWRGPARSCRTST